MIVTDDAFVHEDAPPLGQRAYFRRALRTAESCTVHGANVRDEHAGKVRFYAGPHSKLPSRWLRLLLPFVRACWLPCAADDEHRRSPRAAGSTPDGLTCRWISWSFIACMVRRQSSARPIIEIVSWVRDEPDGLHARLRWPNPVARRVAALVVKPASGLLLADHLTQAMKFVKIPGQL
jgi:hypothetical protein